MKVLGRRKKCDKKALQKGVTKKCGLRKSLIVEICKKCKFDNFRDINLCAKRIIDPKC